MWKEEKKRRNSKILPCIEYKIGIEVAGAREECKDVGFGGLAEEDLALTRHCGLGRLIWAKT